MEFRSRNSECQDMIFDDSYIINKKGIHDVPLRIDPVKIS